MQNIFLYARVYISLLLNYSIISNLWKNYWQKFVIRNDRWHFTPAGLKKYSSTYIFLIFLPKYITIGHSHPYHYPLTLLLSYSIYPYPNPYRTQYPRGNFSPGKGNSADTFRYIQKNKDNRVVSRNLHSSYCHGNWSWSILHQSLKLEAVRHKLTSVNMTVMCMHIVVVLSLSQVNSVCAKE